jgi:hypothetical protein
MLRVIATALALISTGAAQADDWKEYENRDYGFTVHFPGDPTVEMATDKGPDRRSFPAHVFPYCGFSAFSWYCFVQSSSSSSKK